MNFFLLSVFLCVEGVSVYVSRSVHRHLVLLSLYFMKQSLISEIFSSPDNADQGAKRSV